MTFQNIIDLLSPRAACYLQTASPHLFLPLTLSQMRFHSNPSINPEGDASRQVPQARPAVVSGASLCLLSLSVLWSSSIQEGQRPTPPTLAAVLQRTFYEGRNVPICTGPQGGCRPPSAMGHLKCDRETGDVIQLHFT